MSRKILHYILISIINLRGRYNGNHYSRIVHTNQGPITVVYVNDPYYYRRGCGYGGYGALAATSLLLTPFWFPFFWC